MGNMFLPQKDYAQQPVPQNHIGLRLKASGQSIQDIVRKLDEIYLRSGHNPLPVLEKLIPTGRKNRNIFSDGCLTYVLNSFSDVSRKQERCYFGDGSAAPPQIRSRTIYHRPGDWWLIDPNSRNKGFLRRLGWGLLELIIYIKGCSYGEAIIELAKSVPIDIHQRCARQIQSLPGARFLLDPYWPEPYIISHSVLGQPEMVYRFVNPYGKTSFLACCWGRPSSYDQVLLFMTCQWIDAQGWYLWEFVAPPASEMVFNMERLTKKPNLPVRIYPDLHEAWELKDSPDFVATWSGEFSFCSDIDWKFLKGREVYYCYDERNRRSMELGECLYVRFQQDGINLKFINTGEEKCKALMKLSVKNLRNDFLGSPERDMELNVLSL